MKKEDKNLPANNSQFLIYQTESGETKIDVRFQDETVWLTQKTMTELFQVRPQNITTHLKNIYSEGELVEEATCKEFLQVQIEGSIYMIRLFKRLSSRQVAILSGILTHLPGSGYGIRTIQELLGHKNAETTMFYTHVIS